MKPVALTIPEDAQVGFIKQDLAFVQPVDTVSWSGQEMPAFGAVSKVQAGGDVAVQATFADGSPAVVSHQAGKGEAIYCGFCRA